MSGSCKVPKGQPSSRYEANAAWDDEQQRPYNARWEVLLKERIQPRWTNFSWISPATLLDSINDQIVKGVDDVIEGRRMRWVALLREARRAGGDLGPGPEWCFAPVEDATRFVIMGDPGEQDASQYAVVCPLLAKAVDAQFMVVMSDVIYPAGDVNDYIDGFYRPYEAFPAPIYALPGNHDWYDGLEGFMFTFCGAEPLSPTAHRDSSYRFAERVAQRLWRRSSRPAREDLYAFDRRRETPGQSRAQLQPGPYYALEAEHVVLVCIDTGVTGEIDAEQGTWLLEVARRDTKPKVLLTGKPLYVDGEYHPGRIRWDGKAHAGFDTVDDIVRHKDHGFVAAIGGDVHNYQHYRVPMRDVAPGRTEPIPATPRIIEYVVSGGGGAYLTATHRFGKVEMRGVPPKKGHHGAAAVGEDDFCCYPLRGDSLALFTRGFGRTLGWLFAVALGPLLLAVLVAVVAAIAGRLPDWFTELGFSGGKAPSPYWVAATAPVLVLLFGGVLLLGMKAGAAAGAGLRKPLGVPIRGLVSVAVAVALGALLVVAAELLPGDPWAWLPQVMVVTALLIAIPVVLILLGYYGRGIGPAVLGHFLLAAAVVAAVGVAFLQADPPAGVAEIGATVLGASVLIGALSLFSAWLRELAPRWYPRTLTAVAVLLSAGVLAYFFQEDERWAEVAVAAIAGMTIALLLLAALLAWPAALAPWLFISADMDPDEAGAEFARRSGTPVERGAQSATAGKKTRWQARLLLTWPRKLNSFVSEVAEASEPPFFKSFLTAETAPGKLTIRCWGVSGYSAQQSSPTLEDQIEIPLPVPQ